MAGAAVVSGPRISGESHLQTLRFDLTNSARRIRSEIYRKGVGAEDTTLIRGEPAAREKLQAAPA